MALDKVLFLTYRIQGGCRILVQKERTECTVTSQFTFEGHSNFCCGLPEVRDRRTLATGSFDNMLDFCLKFFSELAGLSNAPDYRKHAVLRYDLDVGRFYSVGQWPSEADGEHD